MSFISIAFIIFFTVVTAAYFCIAHRWRWLLLLVASCVFYVAYVPAYILVLFAIIVVDYTTALLMEKKPRLRRVWLLASVSTMIAVLGFFKYGNFISGGVLSIVVPLGLSFHTFQGLSYVIEVYRGKQVAERHFGRYALYVMFFPQLVAGPIERPQHLLPQFLERHSFEYERVKMGLMRMGWGFFKKIVIADRLALFVDPVFAAPTTYGDSALVVAAVFFTFQLYLDFSAYCDIAIGAARVLGFELQENFDRPFAATSVAEFWRRWHITLFTWFRDYVYYPLVFSGKKTEVRMFGALLLTFVLTGFWHGANWTYGVFGLLNGAYIVIGSVTQSYRDRITRAVRLAALPRVHHAARVVSVGTLFIFSCIFFRASSMSDAWYFVGHLWSGARDIVYVQPLVAVVPTVGRSLRAFLLAIFLIIFYFAAEYVGRRSGVPAWIAARPIYIRWSMYWGALFAVLYLNEAIANPFIYFQF